ncbi:hypothetical protein ACIPYV_21165, partial [Paenarthrobacter nicotinovorans]|uniref:hypothetical protein n=1 Tax=Paenarthrobacter nicotinovorans TaxID=29320 RepID=UPI00380F688D
MATNNSEAAAAAVNNTARKRSQPGPRRGRLVPGRGAGSVMHPPYSSPESRLAVLALVSAALQPVDGRPLRFAPWPA